ncbi:MAG: hypothetical protein AAFP20_25585, partial [Cyanobacteria bacterium J06614_10]
IYELEDKSDMTNSDRIKQHKRKTTDSVESWHIQQKPDNAIIQNLSGATVSGSDNPDAIAKYSEQHKA